jgi:hypothetical protein
MKSTYQYVRQIRNLLFWVVVLLSALLVVQLTGCFVPAPVVNEDMYLTGGCWTLDNDTVTKW